MSWRGTLLLLFLAALALSAVLLTGRSHTRAKNEPLLGIDPSAADQIIIRESGREISLRKMDGIWFLQSEITDRANPALVGAILQKAAEIVPFDTLNPGDLKQSVSLEALDLKSPKRTITIMAGKNSRTLSLGIKGAAASQLYARLDSNKEVYLIPSEIEAIAFHPEGEFRDLRLTKLSTDNLAEISFSKGEGLQQLLLRKGPQGWSLERPVATRADQKAVITWARDILSAKIIHWMPPETDPATCGFDTPSAIITAREDGKKDQLTISIGSQTPQSPQNHYARCSDRPGNFVISAGEALLGVTTTALRSRQPSPVEYDAVDKIEIDPPTGATPASVLLLQRKHASEDWEISKGGSGTLTGNQVREWFKKLQGVTAREFEPATTERLQRYGLENPTVLRLVAHLSENTAEENAGEVVLGEYSLGRATNGVAALHEGKSSDLMILPESAVPLISGEDLKH